MASVIRKKNTLNQDAWDSFVAAFYKALGDMGEDWGDGDTYNDDGRQWEEQLYKFRDRKGSYIGAGGLRIGSPDPENGKNKLILESCYLPDGPSLSIYPRESARFRPEESEIPNMVSWALRQMIHVQQVLERACAGKYTRIRKWRLDAKAYRHQDQHKLEQVRCNWLWDVRSARGYKAALKRIKAVQKENAHDVLPTG